nr:hypothetical protein [Candidatus Calescibacterium sp.]
MGVDSTLGQPIATFLVALGRGSFTSIFVLLLIPGRRGEEASFGKRLCQKPNGQVLALLSVVIGTLWLSRFSFDLPGLVVFLCLRCLWRLASSVSLPGNSPG